jgi:hypothetical protein
LDVILQFLKAIRGFCKGVRVFAEGEAGVGFADVGVFFTVELHDGASEMARKWSGPD